MAIQVDQIKAVMMGHAVADALGVPVEFTTRGKTDKDPMPPWRDDMIGR